MASQSQAGANSPVIAGDRANLDERNRQFSTEAQKTYLNNFVTYIENLLRGEDAEMLVHNLLSVSLNRKLTHRPSLH